MSSGRLRNKEKVRVLQLERNIYRSMVDIGHVRCSDVANDPNKRPEISCKHKGFVTPECGEHATVSDYGDAATIFLVAGKSNRLFSTQR